MENQILFSTKKKYSQYLILSMIDKVLSKNNLKVILYKRVISSFISQIAVVSYTLTTCSLQYFTVPSTPASNLDLLSDLSPPPITTPSSFNDLDALTGQFSAATLQPMSQGKKHSSIIICHLIFFLFFMLYKNDYIL